MSFVAPYGPLGLLVEPLLRWYLWRLIDRRNVFLTKAAEQELGSE